MNMPVIEMKQSDLAEIVEALKSAIRMMESYYLQSNCDEELQALIDRYEVMLPYSQKIPPEKVSCPHCSKLLGDTGGFNSHLREKHGILDYKERRKIIGPLKPRMTGRVLHWRTKAEYLASLVS